MRPQTCVSLHVSDPHVPVLYTLQRLSQWMVYTQFTSDTQVFIYSAVDRVVQGASQKLSSTKGSCLTGVCYYGWVCSKV